MVELCVLLAADAKKAEVDQPHRGGSHSVMIEVRMAQVLHSGCPQLRQRASEAHHVRELLHLTLLPPHLVVAVLGPASAVNAGGLDVAKGVGRDPDVLPGWRDTEGTDPL